MQEPRRCHLSIGVRCYAGYRGEETPVSLLFGDRRVRVAEVTDRWLAPEYRYFRLRGSDDCEYLVRHDTARDEWELVKYDSGRDKGGTPPFTDEATGNC